MNAVMYIILRKDDDFEMTTGKAAAQAAHAAVEAYRLTDQDSNLHRDWYVANHYTKIVLQTDDLFVAKEYLEARGVKVALIIDEGRTEFDGDLTPTALGCALVNKDNPHIQDTFGAFKLYKETPKYVVIESPVGRKVSPEEWQYVRELAAKGKIDEIRSLIAFDPKRKRRWLRPRPEKPSPLT